MQKPVFIIAALFSIGVSFIGHPAFGAQAQKLLPDLAINSQRVQSSLYFQVKNFSRNDCAVVEGLLTGTGKRTLMRFDVSATNIGTADLFLGNPALHSELFEYSPCHRHYHFSGYAAYELLDASGTVQLLGRTEAFCLEDVEVALLNAGPAKYTCQNQGISIGWADTYGAYLDGQWLDVTNVPPGDYQLRVTINPYNIYGTSFPGWNLAAETAMKELSYGNNVALVPVTIPVPTKIK